MKNVLLFLKKKDLYLGITRYFLGLTMVTYAITKIMKTQFVLTPTAMWQLPLEQVSGKKLTWAFLGYSGWFEILLGFFELIPALLLLFRRTTLAGAVLLLPVSLNVYLINIALNLWSETKILSLILLLLNIAILLFEWRKIWNAVLIIIGRVKLRFTLVELTVNVVLVGTIVYFFWGITRNYIAQKNVLTGDWLNGHPNEWQLVSEKYGDSIQRTKDLKIYFGADADYSEFKNGNVESDMLSYRLDEKTRTLRFYNVTDNQLVNKCTYQLSGDTLRLFKFTDIITHKSLEQLYKKRVLNTNRLD
jgi:hypothetical protein